MTLLSMVIVVGGLVGAPPKKTKPFKPKDYMAQAQPKKEEFPSCFFAQAPPTIQGMALMACEQSYVSEPPKQCCFYMDRMMENCAVVCNEFGSDEFRGQAVGCPAGAAPKPVDAAK